MCGSENQQIRLCAEAGEHQAAQQQRCRRNAPLHTHGADQLVQDLTAAQLLAGALQGDQRNEEIEEQLGHRDQAGDHQEQHSDRQVHLHIALDKISGSQAEAVYGHQRHHCTHIA